MPIWKYTKARKEVTTEEIDNILANLICFKCGKELHTNECPFDKLRAELMSLKQEQ